MDNKTLRSKIERFDPLEIRTDADVTDAGHLRKELKQIELEVKNYWKPLKESAYQTHKGICDKEKKMLDIIAEKDLPLKTAINDYLSARAKRLSDERRAEEQRAREENDIPDLPTAPELNLSTQEDIEIVDIDKLAFLKYVIESGINPDAVGIQIKGSDLKKYLKINKLESFAGVKIKKIVKQIRR